MDPYSVLGVSREATEGEIKSAFRKLAMQHHPDKNPGDATAEAKFKEINEAYQILSDPQKRAMHDHGGFQNHHNMHGGGNPFEFHFGFGGPGGPFGDFEEIFRAMHAQNARRNQDVKVAATLNLEDAFNGRELTLSLQTQTGTKTVKVRVPKGVDNGSRIRIAGAGENHFPNMPAGDLYVTIRIMPHAVFTRAGADLLVRKTIDVFDAMVGCELEVQTMDGVIAINVPKGVQSGQRVRIPSKGMPHLNNENLRGDLYVEFEMQVPMNLSDEQIALVNQIRALSQK